MIRASLSLSLSHTHTHTRTIDPAFRFMIRYPRRPRCSFVYLFVLSKRFRNQSKGFFSSQVPALQLAADEHLVQLDVGPADGGRLDRVVE
jgi:hypothetical protein